jgi:hypothetical protein
LKTNKLQIENKMKLISTKTKYVSIFLLAICFFTLLCIVAADADYYKILVNRTDMDALTKLIFHT